MPSISTQPNRFYPNIPEISQDSESHALALQVIKDALQTHERRDTNYLKSFIRFEELVELGIIDDSGEFVLDTGSGSGGGAAELNDLTDVTISGTPDDNDILGYNLGTSLWVPQTAAELGLSEIGHTHPGSGVSELDDLTDVDLTGAQDWDLLFRDSDDDWKPTMGNLQWDGNDLHINTGQLNLYPVGGSGSAIRPDVPASGDLTIGVPGGDLFIGNFTDLIISNAATIDWYDQFAVRQDLLTFAAVPGGGAEVRHAVTRVAGAVTTTSDPFVDATGMEILSSALNSGDTYLLIVKVISSNTSSAINTNEIHVTNGTEIGGSLKRYESPSATSGVQGQPYTFVGEFVAGANDIKVQHRCGSGGGTHSVSFCEMIAINTNDLGSAYTSSVDNVGTGIDALGYNNTAAAITIGDSLSDYLIFGCGQVIDPLISVVNNIEIALNDGTSDITMFNMEIEDLQDDHVLGFISVEEAIAPTTFTVSGQTATDTADINYAFVAAIRLNIFAEHQISFTLDPADPPSGSDLDLETLNFTTTAPTSNWVFWGGLLENWTASGFSGNTVIDLNVDGGGESDIGGSYTQAYESNNTADPEQMMKVMVSDDQNIALGANPVANLRHNPAPSTATNDLQRSLLVAHSWDLASAVEVFNVGNAGYRTHMLGSATRFYDVGETDYVQYLHDGIDFDVTAVNTVQFNWSGASQYSFDNDLFVSGDLQLSFGGELRIFDSINVGNRADSHDGTNFLTDFVSTSNWRITGANVDIFDGATFRIRDATSVDFVAMSLDGTDFAQTFSTVADWNISGLTGEIRVNGIDFRLRTGAALLINTPTNAAGLNASHDSTDFNFAFSNTTDWNITGISELNGSFDLSQGILPFVATSNANSNFKVPFINHIGTLSGNYVFFHDSDAEFTYNPAGGILHPPFLQTETLRIQTSDGLDHLTESHDGADFNSVFVQTADWNITGLTGIIQAGTLDVDFDAITATSYGGIVEGDLVDKSVSESIAGSWTFTGNLWTLTGTSPRVNIIETDATADEGSTMLRMSSDQFRIQSATDAAPNTAVANLLSVSRAGTAWANAVWDCTNFILGDGTTLRIRDAGDTDWVQFAHDGVDLNTSFVQTANWNITGLTDQGVNVDGNYLIEGYSTGKSIIRSTRFFVEPGTTPGTDIDVTTNDGGGRSYNSPSITNATDLADSASSGSWSLNAGSTILTLDITEDIIGTLAVSIIIHNINSSSTTEMYFVDPTVVGSNMNFTIRQRGGTSAVDWRTIMDAGDRVDIMVSYITSS